MSTIYEDAYVYISGTMFILVDKLEKVPDNKIAAKVSLTGSNLTSLMNKGWREYQELLEHYFEHGQKLVTA